jgi:hypothetical protein
LGTSRSGSELAGKLNRLPDAMVKARTTGLKAAAAKAKPIMQHAPGAASRVGGKTIRVTDRMIGEDSLSLKWGPPGWVRILNDATQPHFIARRGGGSLRRQNLSSGFGRKSSRAGRLLLGSLGGGPIQGAGKGPINIPGVGPRMYAKHPGTKGKHFVEKGKQLARPVITKTYAQEQVTKPLRSVFGG